MSKDRNIEHYGIEYRHAYQDLMESEAKLRAAQEKHKECMRVFDATRFRLLQYTEKGWLTRPEQEQAE